MYIGGGGAAWGSGATLVLVVVVLPGSNLSAKLGSATQGGRLEGEGAAGGGAAAAAAGGRGCGGAGAGAGAGAGLGPGAAAKERRWRPEFITDAVVTENFPLLQNKTRHKHSFGSRLRDKL